LTHLSLSMQIPRKIDDRIKDAIVNVQFVSGIPESAIWGVFYTTFKESLKDFPVANSFNHFLHQNPGIANGLVFAFEEQAPSFFTTKDERFKITISGNEITFNVINGYTGWNHYQMVLEQYLYPLLQNSVITHVKRLGIRYISRFPGVKIFEVLNGHIEINGVPSTAQGQVRTEFSKEGFTSAITLVNSFPTNNPDESPIFSLVDIDVIKVYSYEENVSYEDVKRDIETAHAREKELFFSILKESFIQTLNPTY